MEKTVGGGGGGGGGRGGGGIKFSKLDANWLTMCVSVGELLWHVLYYALLYSQIKTSDLIG